MNHVNLDRATADDRDLTSFVLGEATPAGHLALVDCSDGTTRAWSYGRLRNAVRGLAALLVGKGVRQGDVVAVLAENSLEFVVAYFAVLRSGAVVLPLDPRALRDDWTADVTATGARILLADTGLWPDATVPPLGVVPLHAQTVDADETSTAGDLAAVPGGDAPAVLLSSSGTSGGRPHKAVITHRNLAAGLDQIRQVHRLRDGEVVVAVGPLRHIYGMQMALNSVLREGGTLLIGPTRFQLPRFLDLLREHRVGVAYLVPSVLAEIASLAVPVVLPDLRLIVSGGAPLPEPVATECARLTSRPVVQGFGMTEAGCIAFTPDDRPGPVGTAGVVLPGTEARFVDPGTGADMPVGRPGELLVRGPQITPGYADLPGVAVTDEQGWLHTGDLAVRDHDGYLRIVGRLKSLIKYKGRQIAPAKLEEVVLGHPDVSDALVVGEPDPVAGEVPKAYVVCANGTSLAEVVAYVADRVAPHEKIRLAQRVPRIPRSANGKSVRPEPLRALVVEGPDGGSDELVTALDRAGMVVRNGCGADVGQIDVVFDASGSGEVPRALLAASRLARGGRVVLLAARDERLTGDLLERAAEDDISVLGWTSSSIEPPVAVAVASGAADHLAGSCIGADALLRGRAGAFQQQAV